MRKSWNATWTRVASSMIAAAGLLATSTSALAQTTICPGLPPGTVAFGLTSDNRIYVLDPGAGMTLVGQVQNASGASGNIGTLIGMDFRPADTNDTTPYLISDNGGIFTTNVFPPPGSTGLLASTRIGGLQTTVAPFAGGLQSLFDFNPMANAGRLAGSNDQNYALTGANLSTTNVQTAYSYVTGDPALPMDPNLTAGAYDTNVANSPRTTFFMIDYQRDTLVTIADRNPPPNGSSNTAGGKVKTIGRLVTPSGVPINFSPVGGLEIFTTTAGRNIGVAFTKDTIYCIDFTPTNGNPDMPVGMTKDVVATVGVGSVQFMNGVSKTPTGALVDIAIPVRAPTTADVSVTLTGPASINNPAGLPPTFTATITNLGPSPANSVTVTPTASLNGGPFNIVPINMSTNSGACNFGFDFACHLNPLLPGASATVSFQLLGLTLPPRVNGQVQTSVLTTLVGANSLTPEPGGVSTLNNVRTVQTNLVSP
jgi:hypothetical protein